jgi:hypothetical protein
VRNIQALVDHCEWLVALPAAAAAGADAAGAGAGEAAGAAETAAAGGVRLVDAGRLVLGGHSAGGAVAFEACGALARRHGGAPLAAACVLLDGVPWPRTSREAGTFPIGHTLLVSLRSEPSAWNMQSEVLATLAAVAAGAGAGDAVGDRVIDVFIRGSRHADPIDPKNSQCWLRAVGLLGPAAAWEAYAALLGALGADVCGRPLAGVGTLTAFGGAVAALEARGEVEVARGAAVGRRR